MSDKPALVCLAQPAWDGDYVKSTVRLMQSLAAHYRVLYADYAYTLADAARAAVGRSTAPLGRMLGRDRLRREDGPHGPVWVLTPPPVAPTRWMGDGPAFRAALAMNGRIVGARVRSAMRRLGMTDPVVVTAFAPQLGLPLAGALGERARVYYGYDEISAAPWVSKHGARLEAEYLAVADAVVVTSEGLRASKSAQHPNVHLVPNGADFDLFHEAAGETPESARPCVGFIGSLDSRLDYGLLRRVIGRRTDLDFLFVGRAVVPEADALAAYPNVTLAGAHPAEALPGFLARMDVGTIPFAVTQFTRSIYPLKLNEYLAAGRPVVTTPFAPLGEAETLVHTASDADAFSRALDAALSDRTEGARAARIALARANTWERRAEAFAEVLESAPIAA
ncbi:MAG: glycosyltransferase [Bacteroidota bacterium]